MIGALIGELDGLEGFRLLEQLIAAQMERFLGLNTHALHLFIFLFSVTFASAAVTLFKQSEVSCSLVVWMLFCALFI